MKYIPIIQLFITLGCVFIDFNDTLFLILSNTIGYSFLTSIFFIYYLKNEKKYLIYSAYSLLLISLLNIIGVFIDYKIYERAFILLVIMSYTIISLYAYQNND